MIVFTIVVDGVYQVMSECAALHPDENDSEEDEQEWNFMNENVQLSDVGVAALAHLETVFNQEDKVDGQFEDAAEDVER